MLDPVPIPHGRLPVKAPVIWNVPQEDVLYLPGDLSPLCDLKRPALGRKELIKLRVAVFAQVGGRLADQPRIVEVRIIDGDPRQDRIGLKLRILTPDGATTMYPKDHATKQTWITAARRKGYTVLEGA